jgi:hypothetical protein
MTTALRSLSCTFALSASCLLQGQNPSSPANDWPPVNQAIKAAEASADKECPAGKCSGDQSTAHKERVAAYSRAHDLLLAYQQKWGNSLSQADSLHLLYRLGLTSEAAEEYPDALSAYSKCFSASLNSQVVFVQDGQPAPINRLCQNGVERECRLVLSGCQIAVPPQNRPAKDEDVKNLWTLKGITSDIQQNGLSAANLKPSQKEALQQAVKEHQQGIQ